ncbi:MAG: Na+/H+ antiporter NhaA [Candidatus Rariloculaceae bacterium]
MIIKSIKEFLKLEASAGLLLMGSAALALIVANTPLQALYAWYLEIPISIQVGDLIIAKPTLLWINDGLMAIFFLLVGLELKREFIEGELSSISKVIMPAAAAIGGLAVPALIYAFINWNEGPSLNGWAIPTATDIAFALGILTLLGSRVPISLKLFLLSLAILDDIAAIVMIALFYTSDLSELSLAIAALATIALFTMNRKRVTHIGAYILVGIILWTSVLKSGVHATLAGVVLGFMIPISVDNEDGESLAKKLEHDLHPWVAYFVLPVFAFANAGVSLAGISSEVFVHPVTLGIALGLMVGKPIGVFFMTWLVHVLGIARLPEGLTWYHIFGLSVLCGVGFTMSLFIGTLAFDQVGVNFSPYDRLGVIVGSTLCAIWGYTVLYFALPKENTDAA